MLCLLFHRGETPCTRSTLRDRPFLPVYLAIVDQLLQGTDAQVTSTVRKASHDVIAAILRHQPAEGEDIDLDNVASLLCQTMSDKERSMRLTAGSVALSITLIGAVY